MTPKEKAQELVDKMTFETHSFNAKHCALVTVDEIIKLLVDLSDGDFTYINDVIYYQEVKHEIKKL